MTKSWPQIQVALDLVKLSDAVRIARKASSAGIQWLEAGTPLIKSEGMKAVRALSRAFPKNEVVADMKTLDAGKIESEMAFHAGAKVVSISGLAHDSTVRDSVRTASKYDCLLMADLLMSANPRKRARALEALGVNIVCLHTGIDVQKSLHSRLRVSRTVRDIARSLAIPVAAAGGVTPDVVPGLIGAGVKVIIVGGWITGSNDPAKASRQMVQKLRKPAL
ncbi:MAG TPA: orotidine 5'-phosphate decarboxylase / HUMPS family protein [Candidatus Dormibacteraeota bacterium]|nr:orotidine 5'-phosphate decarboxylase / HUMPS family protein [Candidatus Dormibacteraeota bacterium]